jgi:general stress protein YciG
MTEGEFTEEVLVVCKPCAGTGVLDGETHKLCGGRGKTRPRGFAALDRRRVAAIASKGGKAAHAQGTAHQWSKEEAQRAGALGGRASRVKKAKVAE